MSEETWAGSCPGCGSPGGWHYVGCTKTSLDPNWSGKLRLKRIAVPENFGLNEWKKLDEIESLQNTLNLQDQALGALLEQVKELSIKVGNLANKLEEHMNKPDAHNPGVLRSK